MHFKFFVWSKVTVAYTRRPISATCIHSKNILKNRPSKLRGPEKQHIVKYYSSRRTTQIFDKGFKLLQNFRTFETSVFFWSSFGHQKTGKSKRRKCSIIYDAASKSDAKHSFAVLIIIIFGTWTSTLNYFDFDLEILRISKYYIQTSKLWLRFSKSVKYTSKLRLRNTSTPVMQKFKAS